MAQLDMSHPEESLNRLFGAKVLVIGDVMLDTYMVGDATRISPEAPVPVVKVEETRHLLGGAGNVARNIAALGGEASLVGVVGADGDGQRLEGMLRDAGVRPFLVASSWRPTTVKVRVLARNQQMIRMDMEDSRDTGQRERQAVLEKLKSLIEAHDIVIVSDYNKGMVTENLITDILALGKEKGKSLKVLVDPKPQHKSYYKGAYLLTPNAKEAGESSGLGVNGKEEILAAGRSLLRQSGVENILITLGAKGMALFGAKEFAVHIDTMAKQVFDVTGAGDTVIATIATALAAGLNLTDSCILANYAAGIVVGKVGASTASIVELQSAVQAASPDISNW